MTDEMIFAAAVEKLDPAERAAYVESACGGDREQYRRVAGLLAAHDRATGFLERPAVAGSDPDRTATRADRAYGAPVGDGVTRTQGEGADDDTADAIAFLEPPGRPDSLGRIGQYEVLEVLGRGGFGIVYRAFDEVLQRVVAVKVLAPSMAATSPARKRFIREAQSAALIQHENVVRVHSVGETPLPFLVMEFISGETLQDRLDRTGPLEVPEILRIGRQVAEGLAAAHEKGLIHRDIKPSNILIETGSLQAKITDFGLARAADDASLTRSGTVAGTPMYMAPEQAKGETLDHRADLFSLGSVMYAMATGHPPFRAPTTLAVLKRVAEETPRPIREVIPEVPEWFCRIVEKLHAKNPAERYQSAKEAAGLLGDCIAHLEKPSAVPMPAVMEVQAAATVLVGDPYRRPLPLWLRWLVLLAGFLIVTAAVFHQFNLVPAPILFTVSLSLAVAVIAVMAAKVIVTFVSRLRVVPFRQALPSKGVIAGNLMLAAMILAVGLYPTRTYVILYLDNMGELEVEVDNTVAVTVLRDGVQVAEWPNMSVGGKTEWKLGLSPGRYTLQSRSTSRSSLVTGWKVFDVNKLGSRGGSTTIESDPPRELVVEVKRGRRVKVEPVKRSRPMSDVQGDLDSEALQGDWVADKIEFQGKLLREDERRQFRLVIAGHKVRLSLPGGKEVNGTFHLYAGRLPREIDFIGKDNKWVRGVYHPAPIICIGEIDGPRPTSLVQSLDPNSKQMLVTLRRASAEDDVYYSLFNGEDLTGWKFDNWGPASWSIKDRVLTLKGMYKLHSQRDNYQDFHLRIDMKLNRGGLSAQYFRAKMDPKIAHLGRGYQTEMIFGDRCELRAMFPTEVGGGFIRMEPDKWFTQEVIAVGNRIIIKIDGRVIADYVDPSRTYKKGGFIIRGGNESTSMEIRKIEIGEMPASPLTPAEQQREMRAKLAGNWTVHLATMERSLLPLKNTRGMEIRLLENGMFELRRSDDMPQKREGTYELDLDKQQILFTFKGQTNPIRCNYSLTGDELSLDFPKPHENDLKSGSTAPFVPDNQTTSIENLRMLGLAMHIYHDTNGSLPPAAIQDVKAKDGKPLLSWRVALLPFLDQEVLYRQFKLDEPWDSEHNKKLIARMPKVFLPPGIGYKEPGLTHYRVFVGPGAAFEPPAASARGVRLPEFADGTSNTIMIAESREPVIWTKPDELTFDPKKPLPKLGWFSAGAHVVMGDGSVRLFSPDTADDKVRPFITRNGNEVPDEDVLKEISWHGPAVKLELQRRASIPISDKERLQGLWVAESGESSGQPLPGAKEVRMEFAGADFRATMAGKPTGQGTFKLDTTSNPKGIDVIRDDDEKGMRGIYRFDGDKLILCIGDSGSNRPREFRTGPDTGLLMLVRLRRASESEHWESLFNGKELTGLLEVKDKTGGGTLWDAVGDVLIVKGQPSGYLMTSRSFREFHLSLECRLPASADSLGPYGAIMWGIGEAPVLPTEQPSTSRLNLDLVKNVQAAKPNVTYSLAALNGQKRAEPPLDELPSDRWNKLEIICRDGALEVISNGKRSKVPDNRPVQGHVALKSLGGGIQFRNVKIKELLASKAESAPASPTLLKTLDPAKDKAVAPRGDQKSITVEGGAYRIENALDPSVSGNFNVLLATVLDGIPSDGIIILRARVKLQPKDKDAWGDLMLGDASPSFHGYDWPKQLGEFRGEITEWTQKEVRYPVEVFRKKNPPSIPIYAGLHANGVLWIKDVELFHLPAAKAPAPQSAVQPLRDVVAAKGMTMDLVKKRFEAGVSNMLDVLAAQVDLMESQIALADAIKDSRAAATTLQQLVKLRQEERDLIAKRVEAGVDSAEALNKAEARIAEAKVRLAERPKPPMPEAPTPKEKK